MQRQELELTGAAPAIRTSFGNPVNSTGINPEHGKLQFEMTVGVPDFCRSFERPVQSKVIAQAASGLNGRHAFRQVSRGEFP